ncbi:MAG TPA: DUF6531 domain-containing protein [Chthonomonadaceae bacterium]|nr:DUF6531 domain-containing protein [Chthonomonadaceae bacterium]
MTDKLTPAQWKAVDAAQAREEAERRKHRPAVRVLSHKEMRSLRGRGPNRNRYLNGILPWQRSFRDVNLCTGNLFKSFTDIQVAPAKGAGLALQRTYNSDDDRVGPFGVGWTHAYDIRMEEAQGADDTDYDLASLNPDLNYCVRVDFFGHPHKSA